MDPDRTREGIRKFIEKISPTERDYIKTTTESDLLSDFEQMLEFSQPERAILFKGRLRPAELTEDEAAFLSIHYKKAYALPLPLLSLTSKLRNEEIKFLVDHIDILKEEIKPPVVPPVAVPPPVAPPEILPPIKLPARSVKVEIEEKIRALPKKWRGVFPFSTHEFIRKFLMKRGKKGAYPYEVWRAMKQSLMGIIASPEVRAMIRGLEGIPVDGVIDHELTSTIEEVESLKKEHPIYHTPSYGNIRKYFYILKELGLIKEKGIDKKLPKYLQKRHYYVINEDTIDSPLWNKPQEYTYPLAFLGKKRFKKLMEYVELVRSEEEEPPEEFIKANLPIKKFTVQWAFISEYPEKIAHIASVRGISEEELRKRIVEGKYLQ
jgi:hypothetical protein